MTHMHDGKVLDQWVRATWVGWVLGIPLVALFALAGEIARIGGAQVLVGAGMGTGVGIMQGRVVRRLGSGTVRWVLSCAVGLAFPFLLIDILKKAGID